MAQCPEIAKTTGKRCRNNVPCPAHPEDGTPLHVKKRIESQDRFLDAFVECATVLHAAKIAGIARQTHYDWLDEDEGYAARYAAAEEAATEVLEREARRRAVEGVEEPVGWHKGKPGGYVDRYSDTLLIFLLKARRPAVYRERYEHAHVGADGGAVKIERIERVIVDPAVEEAAGNGRSEEDE